MYLSFIFRYVKDKRPTISPNFNFLGQLLEYEKLLKKERGEQENVSPPLSAPIKKHCAEGAKSPVTPKSARLRFKPFVFGAHSASPVVVQSPTTALSKLSFSAPSPVLEEPNTPTPAKVASDVAFPQHSTTSLDKLSLIPCLAASAESHEATPGKVVTGDIKSPSTGTKRPISSMLTLELSTRHTQGTASDSTGVGSGQCGPDDIKYRSPGFKVKKQLVRPNSIAFSSYPLFDKPSSSVSSKEAFVITTQSESSQQTCCSMDCSSSNSQPLSHQSSFSMYSQTPGNTSNNNTQTSHRSSGPIAEPMSSQYEPPSTSHHRCMVNSNSSHAVEMRVKDPEMQGKTVSFEQARKSRSLEDILSADGEEQTVVGGCPSHVRARRQKRLINAAEMFSQSTAGHESSLRCRGTIDAHHHQSSSSISSSGSHSSLHGSLEIIQVS